MQLPTQYYLLLTLILCFPFNLMAYEESDDSDTSPAHEISIPEAADFAADRQISLKTHSPILLLVSQTYCTFCKQIKRDILHPMILGEDYKGQLLMRELYMDRTQPIVDFQNNSTNPMQFAKTYDVSLTPTLLFLGPNGEELSKRIIGFYTPEMFFFYVDEAIKEAIEKLKKTP